MSEIIQVSLRGSRREFFLNSRSLWLRLRGRIVVQGELGETLATVILKDPTLVALKRPGTVTREIIRKAEEEDLDQDDHNRALASRFQTRIELRQIGVRDQAKRVDGCGPCGRAFCCSTWMKGFHPVTLKMAREQSLSLNPTKISGACGRLMCCLSYELAQYRDSAAKMPPVGTKIGTGKGPVVVTRTDAYQEAVWVRDEDGAEHRIAYDEMPPGPYHKCGDCGCGKKKPRGDAAAGEGGADPGPDASSD